MEFLQVSIRYSKPQVDMTAKGNVGGRDFWLESDSSFLSSAIRVVGTLGEDEFVLHGRTKNFLNRNFTVSGTWAASPLELRLRATKGIRYLVEGDVGDDKIAFDIRRSVNNALHVHPSAHMDLDLRFRSDFDTILDGKVQDYLTGGVFAAFLPCLLRNLYGSFDSP